MFINTLKTVLFLVILSSIFLVIGTFLGGTHGLIMAFFIALFMNGFAYYFSDKLVLKIYKAKPLSHHEHFVVHSIVRELSSTMNIPVPNVYVIQSSMANAFATGRSPSHASIAITTGLINLLEDHELRGVIAHELSHIKNRDILIATIAATIATAIGYLAHMAYYAGIFRSFSNRKRSNPIGLLLISILTPLAASLVQLAISRSREFIADESGARYTQDPLALASALKKIKNNVSVSHFGKRDGYRASTASLFIINPFKGQSWINLFATHPPIDARIAKLHKLYEKNILL